MLDAASMRRKRAKNVQREIKMREEREFVGSTWAKKKKHDGYSKIRGGGHGRCNKIREDRRYRRSTVRETGQASFANKDERKQRDLRESRWRVRWRFATEDVEAARDNE